MRGWQMITCGLIFGTISYWVAQQYLRNSVPLPKGALGLGGAPPIRALPDPRARRMGRGCHIAALVSFLFAGVGVIRVYTEPAAPPRIVQPTPTPPPAGTIPITVTFGTLPAAPSPTP